MRIGIHKQLIFLKESYVLKFGIQRLYVMTTFPVFYMYKKTYFRDACKHILSYVADIPLYIVLL